MRQCGTCTECCTALPIEDCRLTKPQHIPCQHLCAAGCSIYKTRPGTCVGFACEWLLGTLPEYARPDKLGIIMFVRRPNLVVVEGRAGAFAATRNLSGLVDQVIQRVYKKLKLVLSPIYIPFDISGTGLPNTGWRERRVIIGGRRIAKRYRVFPVDHQHLLRGKL